MTTDGTADLAGVALGITTGKTTAIGTVRKEINRLCKESHTRALAWSLHIHATVPHLLVEDLFEWLDEIGARPPKFPKLHTWNEYHRANKLPAQKLVSKLRALLRENGIPSN
jgi:hypothetical protein